MLDCLIEPCEDAADLIALRAADLPAWLELQPAATREWVVSHGFTAEAHTHVRLPSDQRTFLVGLGSRQDRWSFSHLPRALPTGSYRLSFEQSQCCPTRAALAWALGAYAFQRYKKAARPAASLCWPANADRDAVRRAAAAIALVRDLINTPASDMGPAELASAARELAHTFGAECRMTEGDALLKEGYLLIHAVGRASERLPRLIDLIWGERAAPKVTLVGKGVCFDSGGLNIKNWAGMIDMKVDMGGAAHVLGLARMIMEARLPVRLRVLIPAVENAVSGDALRPRDVVRARNGVSVEIANTDAEGRLVLADALVEASRERPALLVDIATLTGSARVALGHDLPALFANDEQIAAELLACASSAEDPLWRLPLWKDYAGDLNGKVGDITNVADLHGFTTNAGAIYAALFLDRFVEEGVPWIHIDTSGYNTKDRPGRPEGGEARNLLALFESIAKRWPPQRS